MNKKILIKKEEFENLDLRKLREVERVDATEDGIEITFIFED